MKSPVCQHRGAEGGGPPVVSPTCIVCMRIYAAAIARGVAARCSGTLCFSHDDEDWRNAGSQVACACTGRWALPLSNKGFRTGAELKSYNATIEQRIWTKDRQEERLFYRGTVCDRRTTSRDRQCVHARNCVPLQAELFQDTQPSRPGSLP